MDGPTKGSEKDTLNCFRPSSTNGSKAESRHGLEARSTKGFKRDTRATEGPTEGTLDHPKASSTEGFEASPGMIWEQ
ncbi:hypothetical protein OPV22_011954 [Ensete ventricosum]|uniref:Uncharacterized protein n=1 Tax=Ensete ventricosum TaxID=4639 RepID=A0AAV8RK81_ENSVE|nr:hypothetical protein OPV22_011954 [Ensete ventricosum]